MLGLYQFHNLLVDLPLGLCRACQRGVAAQILVGDGFQCHHIKLFAHTIAGQHGTCQLGRLLDIVGSAGGNRVECHFLGSSAAGEGGDLIFQLFLAHQVVVALVHLHGVAQSAGGAGDNGDLLYRGRVGLLCRHQCVTDLVIRHDALFLVRKDGILLLVTGNDHLDAFLKVCLRDALASGTDRPQRRLVDDVCQFCAGCTGCHPCHGIEVHTRSDLYLFGVDLQDLFTTLQVRQFHRYSAIKATGAGQRRIQGIRAVGGSKYDDPVVALETVHLGEQLVQGLLPFVVAPQIAAVALLTDGVDLINKHDAGCLFFCLLEQVPDLGGTHAHEHLHKLRAGDGEKGHVGFACHCFGKHGLAGARRAYQQNALGHGGTDLLILAGVVEVVDDLLQVFLCLVLACYIRKPDAVGGLDIDLGVGSSCAAKHHGAGSASCLFHQLFVHLVADEAEQQDGQHEPDQKTQHRGALLHDLAGELGACFVEALGQPGVVHDAGSEYLTVVFVGEYDLVGLDIHLADVVLFGHAHKGAIVHFLHLPLGEPGHKHKVEDQQHDQHDGVVDRQRLFGRLDFFHGWIPPV